jgi:hypothetical protein
MHPTVDEQLRGVRRLLDGVAAGEQLSPRSAAALQDARSILRRLESSWSAVVPFLDWDNRATAALLDEVASLVPGAALPAPHPLPLTAEPELDFEVAHRRNLALRAALTDVIAALATPGVDPAAADRARGLVATHLRERLARDPANRRSASADPRPTAAPTDATPAPTDATPAPTDATPAPTDATAAPTEPTPASTDPGGRR